MWLLLTSLSSLSDTFKSLNNMCVGVWRELLKVVTPSTQLLIIWVCLSKGRVCASKGTQMWGVSTRFVLESLYRVCASKGTQMLGVSTGFVCLKEHKCWELVPGLAPLSKGSFIAKSRCHPGREREGERGRERERVCVREIIIDDAPETELSYKYTHAMLPRQSWVINMIKIHTHTMAITF